MSILHRKLVLFVPCVFVALALAACSGGGSGGPGPTPASTNGDPYGGLGLTPTFDQKVNFTIVVPGPAALQAARRRANRAKSTARTRRALQATNPYVSPNVGSVSFQVASVDGQGLRNAPAAVDVSAACGTTAGCSIPVQGISAAKGTDLFLIQTFSGPGGSGNLVSSSSISVVVPSAIATSFGGTSVTVGGLVQSLSLAAAVPGGTFHYHLPADGLLAVNALDPAGAVIIGNTVLTDAISVVFPTSDASAFAFTSGLSATLPAPARLAFTYNGALVTQTTVSATSTDFQGNPISATAPIPVAPPATIPPTMAPPNKPPLSLYVFDYNANRFIEFAGVNDFESGKPLVQTPRRVFEVAAPPGGAITCPGTSASPPLVAAFSVRADGTIVALTSCSDTATGNLTYVFTYAPTTTETVSAGGVATPPPPTSTYAVDGGGSFAALDLKLDEAHDRTILAFGSYPSVRLISYSLSNPTTPITDVGMLCEPLVGSSTCDGNATTTNSYAPFFSTDIAVDVAGDVLVSSSYPPGSAPNPAPANVQMEPSILLYAFGANGPAAPVQSELAGYTSDLGAPGTPPTIVTDGTDLYAIQYLPSGGTPAIDPAGNPVYTGLSGCSNPPSAQATPNTATDTCLDAPTQHVYLVGFRNAATTLSGVRGTSSIVPSFELGGDQIGRFGTGFNSPTGGLLAVRDGYAYVLNETVNPNEVDIYNTNALTGYHSDVAPVPLTLGSVGANGNTVTATGIVIGPTGTATGGNLTLARPRRSHRNVDAWIRAYNARRAAYSRRRRQ